MYGRGKLGRLSELDLVLAEALDRYESGLCSCGQPLIHTSDPANSAEFGVRTITCSACGYVEGMQEKADKKNGQKFYVVNHMSGQIAEEGSSD